MTGGTVHLYFHAPCFDGLISAVLLSDHLRTIGHVGIELHPVNYDLNDSWQQIELERPAVIVDFMYHPDASIWFDHHATTFLTPEFERHYRERRDPKLVYDRRSPSCAMLIWNAKWPMTGDHEAKVLAADRIDSARYASPQEAVFGDAPALRINASLAVGETTEYCKQLVGLLLEHDLEAVARHPAVSSRYEEYRKLRDRGMHVFEPSADLHARDGFQLTGDGILLFSIDASEGIVSRYAPFTVAPDARYSLGVMRTGDRAKLTAMRNPWREFESVPLGEIFSRFGGGGHQRVASTRLHGKSREQTIETLMAIKDALQSAIVNQARGAPA